MADLVPEPPDGALVMVGSPNVEVVYIRDDHGLEPGDLNRWWSLGQGGDGDVTTWEDLNRSILSMLPPQTITRLYRQAELDQAVAAAQVVPLGEHLKEPGGWCRSCSIQHSEPEWARIHDQLAEEDSRADSA